VTWRRLLTPPILLVVFLVASTLYAIVFGDRALWVETEGAVWAPSFLVAGFTGALIVSRRPGHSIGRLFALFGLAGGIAFALIATGNQVFDTSPTAAGMLAATGAAFTTAGVLAIPATLLRFPTGALLAPRWRWADRTVALAAVLGFVAALIGGGWGGDAEQAVYPSPLYDALHGLGDVLSGVFFPLFMASMLAAATSTVIRYRRSRGEERTQMKWLALSAALLLVDLVLIVATTNATGALSDGSVTVLTGAIFAFVPGSVAIAILRHRLFDIDVVISRALVFGALAVFITLVYAAIVVGIGSLVGGADTALAVAATALVALAFEPVRERVQRWANRMVYGTRATPYEVLSTLTERLAQAEHTDGLMGRVAERLADGTGAQRAVVWVGDEASLRPMAVWPPLDPPAPTPLAALGDDAVPVMDEESGVVGALSVTMHRGDTITGRERRLMGDLAGSVALVMANLRLNRALEARAEELTVSRRRIVEAQDEERRRLERDLHDGAQQSVVGLKVRISLAERMARGAGSDAVADQLAALAGDAQEAITEIRNLAKGIYPPLLVSDGLGAAAPGIADSSPLDVAVEVSTGRHPLEIESAVYFCVSEALTNAAKAGAASATIAITDDGGELRFRVSDDGPGFDPEAVSAGSGLANMQDRVGALDGTLAVASEPGDGTVVEGRIPLTAAAAAG
jgi:signal transduction histidine kinase